MVRVGMIGLIWRRACARRTGEPVRRRRLSREAEMESAARLLRSPAALPGGHVGLPWRAPLGCHKRIVLSFGVKLIAPTYVSFRAQKNGMVDSKALCEAARRREERGRLGALGGVLQTQPPGGSAHPFDQRAPRPAQRVRRQRPGWALPAERVVDEEAIPPPGARRGRSCLQLMIDTVCALLNRVEMLDKETAEGAEAVDDPRCWADRYRHPGARAGGGELQLRAGLRCR